jgi:hypothetical protein
MSSLSRDSMWTGEKHCNPLAGRWFSCEEISAEQKLFVLGELIQ